MLKNFFLWCKIEIYQYANPLKRVFFGKGMFKMEENQINNETTAFRSEVESEEELKNVIRTVYDALTEKGYNPLNQIVGYILSEDPTYITNYRGARSIMRKIDRDELLTSMLKKYLDL